MATYIKMPRLGLTMTEGTIVKWFKNEGDQVEKGEKILEIESDKSVVPFESPEAGVLLKIIGKEGDVIECQTDIAVLGEAGETYDEPEAQNAENTGSNVSDAECSEKEKMDHDIIVIGGGPGGYVAAIRAAQLGKNVCLIEKHKLGGTCLNVGCIPTKALLKSMETYKSILEADEFGVIGVAPETINLDLVKVQARKNKVVTELVNGVGGLLRKNKVTVVEGVASFVDKNTVAVGDKHISGENIIIASGSKVKTLPIKVDPNMPVYTSSEVLDITDAPKEMVVIGGGVIGVELAYFLAGIGVKVKIVEFMDRILPMVDTEITRIATKRLEAMGIEIHTKAKVSEVVSDGVIFEENGKLEKAECQAVLMAVGRAPATEDLALENAGVLVERGAVCTDDGMRTNVANIYAIGDVNGKSMLAHTAFTEGVIAAENICGENRKMDYGKIPSAIYIQPEIASIGLTEEQAREKYGEIKVGVFPMAANGKAKIEGDADGLIKVIAEPKYMEILGVHMYCPHATDMIAETSLAMTMECTADELIKAVHPHPTISEALHEACHAVNGGAIHC